MSARAPLRVSAACALAAIMSACTGGPSADGFDPSPKSGADARVDAIGRSDVIVAPEGVGLSYLARPPRAGSDPYPALIFLHGSGERGGPIERVLIHGPWRAGAAIPDFPFLLIAPHLPAGGRWSADQVLAVIDDAAARFPTDPDRIYLTGLSLGGHGAWETGLAAPERLAAIAPISGRGDPARACDAAGLPVWAFHGVADDIVAAADNQAMVDAVRACGGAPGLTLYPDVGHDAWTRTYDDPRLYEWLLSQRLSARAGATR